MSFYVWELQQILSGIFFLFCSCSSLSYPQLKLDCFFFPKKDLSGKIFGHDVEHRFS
jgi:hypothetical protein